MLRSLLTYAQNDDSVAKLVDAAHAAPQRAFVSSSLRPYLLASLIDADPERPARLYFKVTRRSTASAALSISS